MSGGRGCLVAMGYVVGLLSAVFGVWLFFSARSWPHTDVGAIISGYGMTFGFLAAVFGVMVLIFSGLAELSSRTRPAGAPLEPPRHAERRSPPPEVNDGFHDATKPRPRPP
jgi:hypothetical protein